MNHLCPDKHASIMTGLAALLQLALPHFEAVIGDNLRSCQIQVIVGAFEHYLEEEEARISDWHIDGTSEEGIVATATSYVEIGASLSGGSVDFAYQHANDKDDPKPIILSLT